MQCYYRELAALCVCGTIWFVTVIFMYKEELERLVERVFGVLPC